MIPGWWTEHAVSERLAELRREAEHQRLVRWGRRGGKARRLGSVHWNGWVDGVLDGRWSEWFQGLQIDNQGGETILSGTLPDQPALHGILDKVRDLGLSIIAVRRLPARADPRRT